MKAKYSATLDRNWVKSLDGIDVKDYLDERIRATFGNKSIISSELEGATYRVYFINRAFHFDRLDDWMRSRVFGWRATKVRRIKPKKRLSS